MSNKVLAVATAAFEITKMVLVIAANTTCKMVSVGKNEVVKQYNEYQQKATPQQLAAIKMFTEMTSKGTTLGQKEFKSAKGQLEDAKGKAAKKMEQAPSKPKK